MQGRFANIIVDISHEKVDRPFQYRIPEALLGLPEPGMKVRIPFGSGNKLRTGYIIEITDEPEFDVSRLKEIDSVIEEGVQVESRLIRLAFWMKEHYGSTMINALKTVLPVRQKLKQQEKKEICLRVGKEEARAEMLQCERKHQGAKARVLRELIAEERLPQTLVARKLNISPSTFRSLQEAGLIAINSVPYYRNPVKLDAQREAGHRLSERQQFVVDSVLKDYDDGIRQTYLLRGITGSGKTEVYMELIAQMIQRGRQAVMLIPEIALTYQTVLRFYKRFGDRVSVMNSTLSPGEKYDQCERARKGEIDVIIGPRSALFTPFPDIGIIIIDEEHENSYKSETMPKYHARETAEELAALHGASVFLGSATPSLESFYRAKQGKYKLFTLNERLTGGVLPTVYVEDLRQELKNGNRSIFSKRLQSLLEDRLERGEQSMLFLNRRGYAGFVSCRMCGHVMKCPHCDVSLSEHRNGTLVCHYCGFTQPAVKLCPECGSKYILGFRAGTEQIEEQLHKLYPDKKVLRMDADTTKTKDSYEKILSAFSAGEADILVGTQMIVKGHDFPNVTLMGILAADMSLSVNDYRAGERTFQLLTQAAGRAGRGTRPGEVVIQTYQPEHYSILHAAAQDYEGFYEEEILYRQMLSYPPVSHILAVQVTSAAQEGGEVLAGQLKRLCVGAPEGRVEKTIIIGPAPAFIGRINDIFRYVLYVKNPDYEVLIRLKNRMEHFLKEEDRKDESVQFDFDPMSSF
ncbi:MULTISPECIES: replication restart helicase PriA [Eisenbergiella]|uniref:Replication restart protein PriA n=1 Tax=Eisenbergiella porci TaxID=2652274 RepID=A0A6N7VZS8_9FIRM|nr:MULTISPECIES: primosomal protein N' [Eisenbergiella]MDY2653061.1 primosomal protein N' [Eisenbergiella porci]MSS88521.1 primosomal protein N' [Eisenbergiella porci]